ncbi:MAG: nuclear transport factor 2 family protein [Acidimicrobiales bacterium]
MTERDGTAPCRCCDEQAVAKVLYTYAERIDAGDFEGLGDLFAEAEITFEESPDRVIRGRDEARQMYEQFTRRYPDNGTPHTRHMITNVIVDVDDNGDRAAARSSFCVMQRTDTFPLQPVIVGRYRDELAKSSGQWHFTHRHMLSDHVGDLSQHMLVDPF